MFPSNEAETIMLYKLIQDRLGFRIVHLQEAFPDAIIESEDGNRLVVEFELLSKSFQHHNHDPDGCQLIICWIDNWPEAPLPVQALEQCAWEEAEIVNRLVSFSARRMEWERERRKQSDEENTILKYRIETLRQKVEQQRCTIEAYRTLRCRPAGTVTMEGIGRLCFKCSEDLNLFWYFLELVGRLPDFNAIQDWIRTADIPGRYRTNRILKKITEVTK